MKTGVAKFHQIENHHGLGCSIPHRSGRPLSEDGGGPEKDKVEQ